MTKNQGKRQKVDTATPMFHILELAKKYFKITMINMLMKIVKKQRNRLKVNEVYQRIRIYQKINQLALETENVITEIMTNGQL